MTQQIRLDGLINALSGIGGLQDRTQATTYGLSAFQPDETWTAVWTSNGIGAKVCQLQIDDMVRNWIEFPEDKEGKLLKELDRLKVRELAQRQLYWTDLYGGCLTAMLLEGTGDDLAAPLTKGQDKAHLAGLQIFPAMRKRVLNTSIDIVRDTTSPYFGEIEFFRVQVPDSGGQFTIHATRCITSKGTPVPPDENIEWRYRYWGASRLQRIFDSMNALNTTHNAFANIIHQLSIGKLTIPGLMEMLADDDTATANLKKVVDGISMSLSYLNLLMMPEGGGFERDQVNTSGFDKVVGIFREWLATEAGYPTSILFETATSSGLSASTSETEATKRYYNSVKVRQETDLRPWLETVIRHVAPTIGLAPDIRFEFKSLDTPDPKTVAEIRKIHAETDKIRIESGSIFPDESRSRLEGETYSDEVVLNAAYSAKGPDELDMEAQLQEAQKALAAAQKAQGAGVPGNPDTKAPTPLKMPKAPAPKASKGK